MVDKQKSSKLNKYDQMEHQPMLSDLKSLSLTPNYHPLRMITPSSLVPLINTYQIYFTRTKSDPYKDWHIEALSPYQINSINHAAAIMPKDPLYNICDATNSGDPTILLLWIATCVVDAANKHGRVNLL